MYSTRRRIRSFAKIVTAPPKQLKRVSGPPSVNELFQQMSAGDAPFWSVTANVTFNTVPPAGVERSNKPAQSPAEIVSFEAAGSVKKHGLIPPNKGKERPELVPFVVLRPLTAEQSLDEIGGIVFRR